MKKVRCRILKVILIVIIVIAVLVGIVMIVSMINNKIELEKEQSIFIPPGKMVTVNSHDMHVYTEGKGDSSLVFMSGGGTCSPFLDFKTLYTKLSSHYKIAIIEKSGYGFSEISGNSRDIDTIVEESRLALVKAGIEAPYILMPHSMSGIEALYWADKYPQEVKAIIGLDPAVPRAYENMSVPSPLVLGLISSASKTGLTRFFPSYCENSPAMQNNMLTEKDKEVYRSVFYRKTMTIDMRNEIASIKENAKVVQNLSIPNVPMLFFASNGEGTGYDKTTWRSFLEEYISSVPSGEIIELECSHYVHDYEYNEIAEKSIAFIGNLSPL